MKRIPLAILTGCLFGFALTEIGLRAASISSPRTMVIDPVLGATLRPDFCWRQEAEGSAGVCTNRAGFRDIERREEKPDDIVRIAVLGDSYVEADQVEADRRFTNLLEAELNGRGGLHGRPVEILNFGVRGYGTGQELLVYQNSVRRYSPDITMLAFMAGNDVLDNTRKTSGDPFRPYFSLVDGRPVREAAPPAFKDRMRILIDRVTVRILDVSRVGQVVARAWRVNRERSYQDFLARTSRATGEWKAQEIGLSIEPYRDPPGPETENAWALTEALIATLNREVGEAGGSFRVIVIGTSLDAHPDPAVRSAYCETRGLRDFSYPESRIGRLGEREGFPVLPLSRIMADSALVTGRFYHGFPNTAPGRGHWNEEGHRLAARELARWFNDPEPDRAVTREP